MTLGEKVRELRKIRRWTQFELAQRSRLGRSYISVIELDSIKRPSVDVFLKLAKAFNIPPEELYATAGIIPKSEATKLRPESIKEICERLYIMVPNVIPVYPRFPIDPDNPIEPVDYVYKNLLERYNPEVSLQGYIVQGRCLEPTIKGNDIIIVDSRLQPAEGDYTVGLYQGEMVTGQLKEIDGVLWFKDEGTRICSRDCQPLLVIIEVVRRLH